MRSLLVVVLLAKIANGGACPPHDPVASTLTPADSELAPDGGVIVAVEPSGDYGAKPAAFEYAAGVAPTTRVLAPGLTVYATPATGDLTFAGLTFRRAAKAPALLPAPSVSRVVYTNTNRPNITEIKIVATLKTGTPTTAIAIVVFGVDKGVTTPRSFARVTAKATSLDVYHNPPKCNVDAPNTILTAAGDHVAFAWVDAAGRLGKLSSTLTVSAGKP